MKKTISRVLVLVLGLAAEVANADFTFGTPTKVPNVNSPCFDVQPDISTDGLSLYFVSTRPHEAGIGYYNIWVATRETTDDDWGTPVKLGPPVNSAYCEAEPSISSDGLELYFCDGVMDQQSTRPGGYGGVDIWISTRTTTNDPWEEPKNLGSIVNSSGFEGDPEISADGLSLFLHSHRPGGYGRCELYISTRATTSDLWEPLVNLGRPVNSGLMEVDPSISADGLMLFFCSDRIGGGWSGDLWLSRRRTTDDEWREPVNLGPNVNTSMSELDPSISADGRMLYFNREEGDTAGTWDIWQVSIEPVVDLNGDEIVDSADMCIMIDQWGENYPLCDIGPMPWGDGIVDVEDLKVLAEHLLEEILPIGCVA